MKRDRSRKKRRQLARAVERAAVPERPCARAPRYLVQPHVTAACAASLHAIAAALRDETLVLGENELQGVKTFILDGRSPFFGRDATAAKQEAVRLQHTLIGARPALATQQQLESKGVTVAGPALTPS